MRDLATSFAERSYTTLSEFLRLEAAGGLLLMAATVVALLIANSPLSGLYANLLEVPLEVRVGTFGIAKPLLLWINDGLMAVFFFLVGLELKREVIEGHLSTWRQASFPAFAALGGMLVPAIIYVAFNTGDEAALRGWAIPTATDIAFALGVMSLLGSRVPPTLKVLLLSVAIFDDLGAIIIIALFYTDQLSLLSLFVAAALIGGLVCLNRLGVVRPIAYLLLGVPLWVAVLKSGVHATLAGVVLAMFIPLKAHKAAGGSNNDNSPLRQLEHALHPWVAFGVLPLFAFANAGVSLSGLSMAAALHGVPLGIVGGLLFGKPIGILLVCWLAVSMGLASLPGGLGWRQIQGVALLCGVGFTMSLFIASLAFDPAASAYGGVERLAILVASVVSGLCGYLLLHRALRREAAGQ